MKEPLKDSFLELADDVLNRIMQKIPGKSEIYLFGHSVGAIMAWHIAPILSNAGYTVKELFLSASQNPGAFPEKVMIEAVSDNDMLKLIGYEAEKYDQAINDQFMKVFFPILKKDIQVCKSFVCDGHFVDVKSIVLYGVNDVFTNIDEMKKWGKYVNLVSMYEFPGEHLFIENKENVARITELINAVIEQEKC